jgi:hypothetical protein
MKRTAYLVEEVEQGGGWVLSENKITCEVVGEMNDGVKVWRDIESGKQYGLLRMLGKYYFYKF